VLRLGLFFGGFLWAAYLHESFKKQKVLRTWVWVVAGLPLAYCFAGVYWLLIGLLFYADGQLLKHTHLIPIALRHWWLPLLSLVFYYAGGAAYALLRKFF